MEEKGTLCVGCRETMKNMCQMLLELSLENNEVYQEDFERPLLKVSRQFYRVGLFPMPSTHYILLLPAGREQATAAGEQCVGLPQESEL